MKLLNCLKKRNTEYNNESDIEKIEQNNEIEDLKFNQNEILSFHKKNDSNFTNNSAEIFLNKIEGREEL